MSKKSNLTSDKTELFETMPVPKAVLKLALPMVAATVVMMLYSLADTYFVGMLDDPFETSAVTLVAAVILAFNAVNNLFGIGCSSLMSRSLGAKDYEMAGKASAFGFYGAVICGALISAGSAVWKVPLLTLLGARGENFGPSAGYLFWTVTCGAIPAILNVVLGQIVRSEGSAMLSSIGMIGGCLLNIVLDPVFILPQYLGMRAAGAGCATFISNTLACVYYIVLILVKQKHTVISIRLRDFTITKKLLTEVCGVGIPSAIQNLLNVTGMTILNNFMAQYGSEAVSAIGITHKMNLLPLYIAMGFGQGITPIVGYNYASGNSKRLKASVNFAAVIMISLMVISNAGYFFFADRIIQLFMKNRLVVDYGSAFLKIQCFEQVFIAVDFLAVGVFQACGMGQLAFLFAILRKIVLEIPAMFLLNRIYPMYGLAFAQPAAEIVLAAAAVISLRSIYRKLDQKSE